MDLYTIQHIRCSYKRPFIEDHSRVVLEIESLQLQRGQKIFIVGESGIGKSTILETIGLMNDTAVQVNGSRFIFHDGDGREVDLMAMWHGGDGQLSQFRRKNYSFIFQSTNLMPNFTAYENVAYTRMLQGYSRRECFERARQVLADLGLEHIGEQRMAQELSGGQQQRLAFARAILPDFTVLFGDEPTGNLDPENAERVMQVLADKLDEHEGASAVIVSHDMYLAMTFADVIVKIRKGTRPRQDSNDEEVTYGIIDQDCVFMPTADRSVWSNGRERFATAEFEEYLRKK